MPTTLDIAVRRHSEIAFRHYLTEVHQLGAELSISLTLAPCSPALQALAERSGDDSSHRADEPYRRALTGIYSRLAGTLRALTDTEALRHAIVPGEPYRKAGDFLADLMTIRQSLEANHGGAMVRSRLAPLIRAVQVFGFHLATTDLRQSSDKHEAVLAELLAAARIEADYAALPEDAKQTLLLAQLQDPRSLRVRGFTYSEATEQRARRLREGPQAAGGLRPRDHPPLHHQPHRERERSPGGARPAEGKRADAGSPGARRERPRRARPHRRAAVRDHRRPALGRGDHARLLRSCGHRGPAAQLGRRAGHHARLLRQQQGRRLLHRQLGALPGLDRARAHVRGQARPDAQAVSRPRRHRRSRRRPELPGDPGAAARHGEGPDPPHRAGRGDQCQVRQSRDRPAQPRDLDVGRAGGDPADRRPRAGARVPRRRRRALGQQHGRLPQARLRDAGLHGLLLRGHARSPRSPSSTSARAPPRARRAAASTTCEPSPGASPGARAG